MNHSANPLIFIRSEEGKTFQVFTDLMTFKLVGNQTKDALFLCSDEVPPGGGVTMHRQAGQETFLIFEGELEFRTLSEPGEELIKFIAKRGDIVHINERAPHAYKNISTVPARLFIVFVPAGAEQFFQEVGNSITERQTSSPPNPERMQTLMHQYGVELVKLPDN